MLLFQCIIALTLISNPQSTAPLDSKAILEKTQKLYLAPTSYHFEHDLTIERKWPEDKVPAPMATLSFVNASDNVVPDQHKSILPLGDRYREEVKNQQGAGYLQTQDGFACTMYCYAKNEYMKGKTLRDVSCSVDGSMFRCVLRFPFTFFKQEAIKEARLVRQEKVMIEKKSHDCYVIEGRLNPSKTDDHPPTIFYIGGELFLPAVSIHDLLKKEDAGMYVTSAMAGEETVPGNTTQFVLWIDSESFAVLRSKMTVKLHRMSGVGTDDSGRLGPCLITFTDNYKIAKLNMELPDDLFKFVLPKGAKEISNVRAPKK